ncbi:ribonuclease HII [Clostridiaceae bacterium NSJ-31]|uniref:Ribonuclease HII n=1 Tax=Ligaoa zhengdingensis TaxID=2763658 RepID=A0A926DZ67_9FIRM|nr:ribonuclease HII [Ligaoa zhengdingensis]MBC8546791.1 ribonuclease HII [Ligaoa zhengdingensis]
MSLYEFERERREQQGLELICGVDEAGRGPLAGPVYAAAVILPGDAEIEGLNDSKKLTEKKREALFDEITARAVAYQICAVDEKTIDEINILQATLLAMRRCVLGLAVRPQAVYIDGNQMPDLGGLKAECVVGGDASSASIAAASILAKVSRDRYMARMAEQYPQYQFERHKGYGTKLHYQMLEQYGMSPIHRRSFLKKWEARR